MKENTSVCSAPFRIREADFFGSCAVRLRASPRHSASDLEDSVTFEGALRTVTLQLAFAPLKAMAVITAVPVFFAHSAPEASTVTTDFLLLE